MSELPFDIIFHDKTPLVAGMKWQALDNLSRRQCRAWVKGMDANVWLMLPGAQDTLIGYAQLGLSSLPASQTRRACSLAVLMLPLLGKNGWGIFRLADERYWFVAATDGRLSPLSDLTGSAEHVRHALRLFLDYVPQSGDVTIFCPAGFLPDTPGDGTSLTDLLPRLMPLRPARLRPVSDRLPAFLWSAALVAVLLGYFGWQQYQASQHEKQIAAAREAYLTAKKKVGSSTSAALQPWAQQPSPAAVIRGCTAAWDAPLSVAGWLFSKAECADGQVRMAWHSPKGGNVQDFRTRILHDYPGHRPFFNIPGSADTGGISLPVSVIPDHPSAELPDGEEVTRRLTGYAQRLNIPLTLAENVQAVVGVDGNSVPLPWKSWRFSMQTDIPASQLFGPDLRDTGIRLSGITVSLADARLHYQIQGTLYAKR